MLIISTTATSEQLQARYRWRTENRYLKLDVHVAQYPVRCLNNIEVAIAVAATAMETLNSGKPSLSDHQIVWIEAITRKQVSVETV